MKRRSAVQLFGNLQIEIVAMRMHGLRQTPDVKAKDAKLHQN
jgi:hypothetical protein